MKNIFLRSRSSHFIPSLVLFSPPRPFIPPPPQALAAAWHVVKNHRLGQEGQGLVISGRALGFVFPIRKLDARGREIEPTDEQRAREEALGSQLYAHMCIPDISIVPRFFYRARYFYRAQIFPSHADFLLQICSTQIFFWKIFLSRFLLEDFSPDFSFSCRSKIFASSDFTSHFISLSFSRALSFA
jgi:hypothetical protein